MQVPAPHRPGMYFLATAIIAIALFSVSVFTAEKYAAGDQEVVFLEQQALITNASADSMQQRLDFIRAQASEIAILLREVERGPQTGRKRASEILERAQVKFEGTARFILVNAARDIITHAGFQEGEIDQTRDLWIEWVNAYWDSDESPGSDILIPPFAVSSDRQIAAALFPVPATDLQNAMSRSLLVLLIDISDLAERYVAPLRSGEFGAGFMLDETGRILYDHETEIIGRNVFDGMHEAYPDLTRFDNRLMAERRGKDTYHFTRQRSGKVVRKLAAWSSAELGPRKVIIALSAPDTELAAGMTTMRWLTVVLGLIMAAVLFIAAWFFMMIRTQRLQESANALEKQLADGEIALSESERRLAGFAEALPDLAFLFDEEGRYREIYGEETLLVQPRERLIGRRLDEMLPADTANLIMNTLAGTLTTGRQQFISYSLNIRGKEIFFEGKTSRLPEIKGSKPMVIFVTRDVTSRMKAEQRLRAAIDSMADGVTLWDEEDRLVLFNQQYFKIYPFLKKMPGGIEGKTYEEILRFSLQHIKVQSERARKDPEGWIAKRMQVHRSSVEDAYIVHLDDGRWISVRERAMGADWIVGIRSDITALKQAEQEALDSRLVAEMASKAKSEFLANMSHELRTPLNAILGLAEMIERQELGPVGVQKYIEYAEDIGTSGKHLLTLLSDILHLSRTEIGGMALDEVELDLTEVAATCRNIITGLAEAKAIEVHMNLPEKCQINGDDRALRQILLNLLSNAIKFTGYNGRIDIILDLQDAIHLSVKDNGIGIKKEDIPQVMEPFVQLDSPGTSKEAGTGIGLSLSRQLAELHGGTLELESELGVGTTARLTLPLSRLVRTIS